MSQTYYLSKIFPEITLSDFPKLYGGANKSKVLLKPGIDKAGDKIFKEFLEVIGVDPEIVTNYGTVSYNNDGMFIGHSPAFVCNVDGEVSIVIGSLIPNEPDSQIQVSVKIEEIVKKSGTKKQYEVNDNLVTLFRLTDKDGKPLDKIYLDIFDGVNHWRVPISKKSGVTPEQLQESFKGLTLAELLVAPNVYTGSSRVFCKANKMFTHLFDPANFTFPKDGVYLLAKNGKLKLAKAGSHPNIDKDIWSATWQIIGSSHPELLVAHTNADKQLSYAVLDEVYSIEFTSAAFNNEAFNYLKSKGYTEESDSIFSGEVIIQIVKPNPKNVNHIPVNKLTAIPSEVSELKQNQIMLDGVMASLPPAPFVPQIKESNEVMPSTELGIVELPWGSNDDVLPL